MYTHGNFTINPKLEKEITKSSQIKALTHRHIAREQTNIFVCNNANTHTPFWSNNAAGAVQV